MKNLKYGSRGSDVRTLQLFLKEKGYWVIIDPPGKEHYGPNTRDAVKAYQKNEKANNNYPYSVDGKFGPGSRRSMVNAKFCKYQRINIDKQTTLVRMRKSYTTAKVINPKAQTIKQMYNSIIGKKPNLLINGTLFDTATMTDLAYLKVDGKNVGIGYYDDDGLYIDNYGRCSIGRNDKYCRDFMGGSPAILLNGTINTQYLNLDRAFIESRAPRTTISLSGDYINVFITRGRSWWRGWKGCNLEELAHLHWAMADYDNDDSPSSINLDGGGSTGGIEDGKVIIGWSSRKVANGVAFWVEDY